MKRCHRFSIVLLAASMFGAAAAQTLAAPATNSMQKPVDSRTVLYRSVFDSYVSANDDKPVAWRDANALVGSIGGWRVYARESQQTAPASDAPAATGSKPAPHKSH